MSAASSCDCPCPDSLITEIPGAPGADGASGADGADGVNAYTLTTFAITLPAAAGPVTSPAIQTFVNTAWMAIGQVIFISDGTNFGTFRVLTVPSATGATLQWLEYPGDAAGTTVIASGAKASPAGEIPVLAAPLPTALTDNSTGTASNTIAAGAGVETLMFQVHLPSLGVGASELMTNYTLGYAFKILAVDAVVETVGAGAGATMTINLEIGAVNLTGGVVNPTLANTATAGAVVAGTAVTANNVGTAADTLSIEVAGGGTVFSAGVIVLMIRVQNMDTANAIASLADHVNDLITSLT